MSVNDLPTVLDEEWEVAFLLPTIMNGFLFYKTGHKEFLLFSLIALLTPSFIFVISYVLEVDYIGDLSFKPRYGFNVMESFYLLSYIPWAIGYIIGISGLIFYLDHTDLIMVALLITSFLLTITGSIVLVTIDRQ